MIEMTGIIIIGAIFFFALITCLAFDLNKPKKVKQWKKHNKKFQKTITIREIARSEIIRNHPKFKKVKYFRYIFEKIRTISNKYPDKCPRVTFRLRNGDIHFTLKDLQAMRQTLLAMHYNFALQRGRYNYDVMKIAVETGIKLLSKK